MSFCDQVSRRTHIGAITKTPIHGRLNRMKTRSCFSSQHWVDAHVLEGRESGVMDGHDRKIGDGECLEIIGKQMSKANSNLISDAECQLNVPDNSRTPGRKSGDVEAGSRSIHDSLNRRRCSEIPGSPIV